MHILIAAFTVALAAFGVSMAADLAYTYEADGYGLHPAVCVFVALVLSGIAVAAIIDANT
jgi:hypothetical protein